MRRQEYQLPTERPLCALQLMCLLPVIRPDLPYKMCYYSHFTDEETKCTLVQDKIPSLKTQLQFYSLIPNSDGSHT